MGREDHQLEARPEPESGREKKRRLRAELMASSEEREPPPPLQGDTGAKASPDVPRWLGYAAFGLFIIGLVSFLLPWLLFSFWCYRRGRREGIALTEDVEPPLPYFPARLTGWLLASILLPIVDWFTAVHVPTMCYQQGLRVGASKGTASESFTDVAELAVWTAATTLAVWIGVAGVAFAVLVTEDNEQPASVEQPALTVTTTPSPTPSPTPSGWQALTYDQQHEICQEAAETLEQAANAKLNKLKPGYTWMTAKSRFYTSCMDCGGPMAVQAYITAEPLIYIGCIPFPTSLGPYIPEGAEQVWP